MTGKQASQCQPPSPKHVHASLTTWYSLVGTLFSLNLPSIPYFGSLWFKNHAFVSESCFSEKHEKDKKHDCLPWLKEQDHILATFLRLSPDGQENGDARPSAVFGAEPPCWTMQKGCVTVSATSLVDGVHGFGSDGVHGFAVMESGC
jgi:hypothetical protein